MRKDMHKLIKVLPARGGGYAKIKAPTGDYDNFPSREPMLPRVGGWNLKENHDWTTPIDRYLLKQVGRLWNDVFSDICAHNDLRSKTQYDVRDYIRYAVHTNVVIVDGKPEDSDGHCIWRRLWVHPDTGILMAIPLEKRYRFRGYRTKFNQVPIDANEKFVEINGIWYRVSLAPFVEADYEIFAAAARKKFRPVIYDVVFREDLKHGGSSARSQLSHEWGSAVYACNKRQLGSREVKKVVAQWEALELAREAA
ncbi:MAG: hypothetical protein SGJ27_09555 [Candidatus Melainabacteria bacterium]|nr:hypothetical protein [Candidatus Melainabacteria bacterium]